MSKVLPAVGTRWGDIPQDVRASLPVGTVLGRNPDPHNMLSSPLTLTNRVWVDWGGFGLPLRMIRDDRAILSYPPGTAYEPPSPTILPDQPPPTPGAGDVWQHMIEMLTAEGLYADLVPAMRERRELGIARYGTPLQIHNGRNHRIDAMQELLDAAVYLWAAGDVSDARRCLFMASALLRRVGADGGVK